MVRSRWWVLIVCGLQFERIPCKDISQRKNWHHFLNSDLTHNQVKTVWKPQHAWKRWRIMRLDDESDRKILECEKQRTGLALVWTIRIFIDSWNWTFGCKVGFPVPCGSAAFSYFPTVFQAVFSVEWLHVQVAMERLLQLPLTSTHGDDKDQERELGGRAMSLLSLSVLQTATKAILWKCKSSHDICSKLSGVSHLHL